MINVYKLFREFARVQPQGILAVNAIKDYENTAATLDTSLQLAKQANATVQAVMDSVSSVTVTDFEKQANDSQKASQDQLAFVNSWVVTSEGNHSVLMFVSWLKALYHLESDNLFRITLIVADWIG